VLFARRQRPVEPVGLLDEIWMEGAFVIDCDKRRLTLFGGEDLRYEIILRRRYIELLQQTWAGWEVAWAYEGVIDIAKAAGFPQEVVLCDAAKPSSEFVHVDDGKFVNTVVTVRDKTGKMFVAQLRNLGENIVASGTDVLNEVVARGSDVDVVVLNDVPRVGIHVDEAKRSVEFWSARDFPDAAARAEGAWSGWQAVFHQDRFEPQIETAAGRLRFEIPDPATVVRNLRSAIVQEDRDSPAEYVERVGQIIGEHGQTKVSVNPDALVDAQCGPTLEIMGEVFDAALSATWAARRP
jgi:hypothetical protein